MSYGLIEISEVGEPEWPLVAVLEGAIFPGVSEAESVLRKLREPSGPVLTLVAHLEGNPLGYAVAQVVSRDGREVCGVESVGLLKEYRRQGVGARIMGLVEGFARMRRCSEVRLECESPGSGVAEFMRGNGFERVALESDGGTGGAHFRKELRTN